MKFTHCIGGGQVTLKFDGKPPANVLSALKASGFRWSPRSQEWWRQRIAGAADLIGAIDKMLNPGRPDGACWTCKDPSGRFRYRGAATPVWCDACNAKVLAAEAAAAQDRQDADARHLACDDFDLMNNRCM